MTYADRLNAGRKCTLCGESLLKCSARGRSNCCERCVHPIDIAVNPNSIAIQAEVAMVAKMKQPSGFVDMGACTCNRGPDYDGPHIDCPQHGMRPRRKVKQVRRKSIPPQPVPPVANSSITGLENLAAQSTSTECCYYSRVLDVHCTRATGHTGMHARKEPGEDTLVFGKSGHLVRRFPAKGKKRCRSVHPDSRIGSQCQKDMGHSGSHRVEPTDTYPGDMW